VNPVRVVVADDQSAVREGLVALLDLLPDIEVVADAADGPGALAAVATHRPDVVLLDLRMPGMDGVAFHEALSRERPGLARRTVFITGDVVPSAGGTTATQVGRQPTVAKPFTFERLEEALLAVMKAH